VDLEAEEHCGVAVDVEPGERIEVLMLLAHCKEEFAADK